jgi:heterodisulfide reductase subunit A-like polyferredoxin
MEDKQIGRRQLIQYSAASIAVAASAKASADGLVPVTQEESQSDDIVANEVDVLVVGGGTAGTIAAIQSARAGARTLLIERGTQLGGTTT